VQEPEKEWEWEVKDEWDEECKPPLESVNNTEMSVILGSRLTPTYFSEYAVATPINPPMLIMR